MRIILIILIIDYIDISILQIQGRIHHHEGALFPSVDGEYKFLQIYFLGNSEAEVNKSCAIKLNGRLSNFFH